MSHPHQFESRHLGNDAAAVSQMLEVIGAASLDQLIDETIPDSIRMHGALDIPEAMDEQAYLRHISSISRKNKTFRSYIGQGYYGTFTPSPILRNIFQNPGWYTQYTPYQAEIAQGRLEALLNFQTMVADLTSLPIANASLLDEGTAAAEAMILFYNLANKSDGDHKHKFFVSDKVYIQTIDVLKTRAHALGIDLIIAPVDQLDYNDTALFGVLLQYPDSEGKVENYAAICDAAHSHNIYVCVASDLLALTLLTPPGEWGADVVVGNAQRFGVPMGYGGPHAAFLSCKEDFKRNIPGRIIGLSIDQYNQPALRMALQTREQHIKREKATSNICTAQALLAIMSGMYAVYNGPDGLRAIAGKVHAFAKRLAYDLQQAGYQVVHQSFFDTVTLMADADQTTLIRQKALDKGVNFYYSGGHIQISLDETVSEDDFKSIADIFGISDSNHLLDDNIPHHLKRTSAYLTHPVFHRHRSETALMRYIKSLENKDISLVHSMISLGSCTMKLNAVSELLPVSWEAFANIHPFVPADQALGYKYIFDLLEKWLCTITGMAACSLQPNSGAQGEYAGLLTIAAYHAARHQPNRKIALIPESAHGTNPASAVMAGMKVVVTRTDEKGNIDLEDLVRQADLHRDDLSCLMVTYPSTHGVFETQIKEICQIIHDRGGLVYMDGANMNAQVGLTSPGLINADVCHLNLHKTFAIPHGGGGPGMGPICVNDKLAPFLPGHALVDLHHSQAIHAVSSAPWGSASILLISYGYIAMLGHSGLVQATRHAILNANYMKARLQNHFQVLYSGVKGRAAHEFILDLRPFKGVGISAEDVSKRLMDYGFHAPTVSFPVAGTIMVEPTESENKAELDKFCDAMLQIKVEIDEIAGGEAHPTDNVLKNAPHTCQHVASDEWSHAYSRSKAAFPLDYLRETKIWPSVSRVNNAFGDRNLVCTCPPVASYMAEG
ncbi:MAG: aminomethyl-transferring glycine dehydrogenase [Saprospiraceae bacterium]|jgi:glycine dehydrogenase|nr:aminomethyl-transferring glycine dehydrogenase [Saprospiraceae bacterium]